MIELHVITPRGSLLVAQVVQGKLVLPPTPESQPEPAVSPAQPAPGR